MWLFILAGILLMFVMPVLIILLIVNAARKKPLKKWWISLGCVFASFIVCESIGIALYPPPPKENLTMDNVSPPTIATLTQISEGKKPTEVIKEQVPKQPLQSPSQPSEPVKTKTPALNITTAPKLTKTPEMSSTREKTDEQKIDLSVNFADIYRAYEENKLRAEKEFEGKRYRITADINNIDTSGLFNALGLLGGARLTMVKMVDNTICFFYAEFGKEQEDALMRVNVGDTITFEGKCLGPGTWVDCVLV